MYIHKLITNVGLVFFYTLMGYTSSSKPYKHQTEMFLVRLSPATQPSYLERSTMDVLGGRTDTALLIWTCFVHLCVLGAKFCLITSPASQCKWRTICRVDASRFRIASRTLPAIENDTCRGVRKNGKHVWDQKSSPKGTVSRTRALWQHWWPPVSSSKLWTKPGKLRNAAQTRDANNCSMLRPSSTSSNKKNHAVAQLVEAQRYKPEGNGFDFR
jgi:hypothetical protein